jgi:NDP-sugar pyrophosphorylase family protein
LSAAPFERALVLTAGLGTRLRPLTLVRAKAAVPVDGEPLARRAIRWLVSHGITDLVLNLHHRPASITAVVGDGTDLGARVRYSWENPVLGSAGGPRHALPLLLDPRSPQGGFHLRASAAAPPATADKPRFGGQAGGTSASGALLLVNGDTITDVNLAALRDSHQRSGALVTMALIPNPRPDKYGGVRLDDRGAVIGFTRRGAAETSFHFVGVQAVEADVFAPLPDGVPAESVSGVYRTLIDERPGSVAGFVSDARFQDIGTPSDLLETSLELASAAGRPGQPAWGARVEVAGSARVSRTLLWDDVTIGDAAELHDCIVADGVAIAPGARYERCAIVSTESGLIAEKM